MTTCKLKINAQGVNIIRAEPDVKVWFCLCDRCWLDHSESPLVSHWSTAWPFLTPASIQMAPHFLVAGLLSWDISWLASHAASHMTDRCLYQTAGFVALTVPCLLCRGISWVDRHAALHMSGSFLFQTAGFVALNLYSWCMASWLIVPIWRF